MATMGIVDILQQTTLSHMNIHMYHGIQKIQIYTLDIHFITKYGFYGKI